MVTDASKVQYVLIVGLIIRNMAKNEGKWPKMEKIVLEMVLQETSQKSLSSECFFINLDF